MNVNDLPPIRKRVVQDAVADLQHQLRKSKFKGVLPADPDKLLRFIADNFGDDLELLPHDIAVQAGYSRNVLQMLQTPEERSALSFPVAGQPLRKTRDAATVGPEVLEIEERIKSALGRTSITEEAMDRIRQSDSLQESLAALPSQVRRGFQKELMGAYGFYEVIGEQGITKWIRSPEEALTRGGRPYTRLGMDPTDFDPVSVALGRTMLQWFPEALAAEGTPDVEAFMISGNVLKWEAHERLAKQMSESVAAGSKYAIIDVETSGTKRSIEDLWQMSVRFSDSDEHELLTFDSPAMARGTVFRDGASQTLEEALVGDARSSTADLKRVLQKLAKDDVIISGHNVRFDLEFMRTAFGRMSEISETARAAGRVGDAFDPEMAEAFDAIFRKVEEGGTFDSLEYARRLLDLDMAPELIDEAKASPSSMQNILLKTNILPVAHEQRSTYWMTPEGIAKARTEGLLGAADSMTLDRAQGIARQEIRGLLTTGTHDAGVDTLLESPLISDMMGRTRGEDPLLKEMDFSWVGTGEQTPERMAQAGREWLGGVLGPDEDPTELMHTLRSGVASEGAVTPFTSMAWDDVNPEIQAVLRAVDERYGVPEEVMGPAGKMVVPAKSRWSITPAEHMMLEYRLGMVDEAPKVEGDWRRFGVDAAGRWDRYEGYDPTTGGGFLTKAKKWSRKGRLPTPDEFRAEQVAQTRRGIPFAFLSPQERSLSAAMGHIETAGAEKRSVRRLFGAELPISEWYSESVVNVFGKDEAPTLAIPKHLLEKAEEEKVFTHLKNGTEVQRTSLRAGKEMYRVDPMFGIGGVKEVAKKFLLSEDPSEALRESAALLDFLGRHRKEAGLLDKEKWGRVTRALTPAVDKKTGEVLPNSVTRYGIQVGTLSEKARARGPAVKGMVARVHDALVQFRGGETIDEGVPAMQVGDRGVRRVHRTTKEGTEIIVEESGPAMLRTGADPTAIDAYYQNLDAAGHWYDTLHQNMSDNSAFHAFQYVKDTGNEFLGQKFLNATDVLKRNKSAVGAVVTAAVAGAGYYSYRKRQKESHYFDETLNPMPYESPRSARPTPQMSAFVTMGDTSSGNPLATAGRVQQLHNGKIGHTKMGPGKYDHLYGG